MADADWLIAGAALRIPRAELRYHATRAGGPGGQHVNKTATRIELRWNLERSSAPSDSQRELLRAHLASRLDAEGWIRLVEAGTRSQLRNREAVTARFLQLVARALRPRKVRKRTAVPAAERRQRLAEKRQRGELKRLRGKVADHE